MKNIEDQENLAGKIALLRLDLNVPLKNKDILDETRIDKIIPVINFLLNRKKGSFLISEGLGTGMIELAAKIPAFPCEAPVAGPF